MISYPPIPIILHILVDHRMNQTTTATTTEKGKHFSYAHYYLLFPWPTQQINI